MSAVITGRTDLGGAEGFGGADDLAAGDRGGVDFGGADDFFLGSALGVRAPGAFEMRSA
jgi:hypothetical protein